LEQGRLHGRITIHDIKRELLELCRILDDGA